MEECALGMEQRPNDAAKKDAHANLKVEEYALRMELRGGYVRLKDAEIRSSREECALSMGQRWNFAVGKAVQIKRWGVVCAQDMVQRSFWDSAALTDVQIKSNKVDCAENIAGSIYAVMTDVQMVLWKVVFALDMEQRGSYAVEKDAQN